jgi:hypothetical protein
MFGANLMCPWRSPNPLLGDMISLLGPRLLCAIYKNGRRQIWILYASRYKLNGAIAEVGVTPPTEDSRAFFGGAGSQHHDVEQNCRGTQAARRPPLRRGLSAWVLSHRARKDNPSSSSRQSWRSFTRTFKRLWCPCPGSIAGRRKETVPLLTVLGDPLS